MANRKTDYRLLHPVRTITLSHSRTIELFHSSRRLTNDGFLSRVLFNVTMQMFAEVLCALC